jgi:hypothetical protein
MPFFCELHIYIFKRIMQKRGRKEGESIYRVRSLHNHKTKKVTSNMSIFGKVFCGIKFSLQSFVKIVAQTYMSH